MKDTSWCNIEKSFHSPTENTEAKDKPLRLQEYFASEDMNDFHTAGNYLLLFIIISRWSWTEVKYLTSVLRVRKLGGNNEWFLGG